MPPDPTRIHVEARQLARIVDLLDLASVALDANERDARHTIDATFGQHALTSMRHIRAAQTYRRHRARNPIY